MFMQLGKPNYVLCMSIFMAQLVHWKTHYPALYAFHLPSSSRRRSRAVSASHRPLIEARGNDNRTMKRKELS
jgi:hypothetical protein